MNQSLPIDNLDPETIAELSKQLYACVERKISVNIDMITEDFDWSIIQHECEVEVFGVALNSFESSESEYYESSEFFESSGSEFFETSESEYSE